ncbi:hypothetical protein [Nannocystis punicea]|uniref:DUF4013 domain-containing protein n=1 Tax=Nannocystis punicea TaxID=2995304 RepID=A0ABY7HCM2_9BACT|nr:hypothetical protein [Nannocystis poenicansa]WAS96835.1 hypothetical protein O0S08_11865 [Nannocystis poenicansa]
MKSLRRVLRVPGLWLGLCALHLGLAWGAAQLVFGAVRRAMGGHLWVHPDRLIAALVELLPLNPALLAVFVAAAVASGLLGAAIALLVRGGALLRLDDPSDRGTRAWAEFGRASLGNLPVLALIGLYGLVLRLVLSFVANALAGSHALVELVVLILLLTFATCSGDLAAARRVLRGERGVHPREYLRACLDVAKNPRLWLASGALTLARWAVAGAIVLVAVHGSGEAWSSWAARGLACVAVFLALWRMAVAVEASRRA